MNDLIHKTATVIFSPNPMVPSEGRIVEVLELPEPRKIRDLLGGVDVANLVVRIDGELIDSPGDVFVCGGETVNLSPRVEQAAFAAYLVAELGATAAVAGFISSIVISTALNYVISAIASSGKDDSLKKRKDAATVYEIANGQNAARSYGAIPMVLGTRRVFPDISARPYTEMVPDIESSSPIYDVQAGQILNLAIVADGTWSQYGTTGLQIQPNPFPAGSFNRRVNAVLGDWTDYYLYNPATLSYMLVSDWVAANGVFVGGPIAQNYNLEFEEFTNGGTIENTQRLTQIFSLGWGDLDISEPRIIDTLIEEGGLPANYRGVQMEIAQLVNDESRLTGYPSAFSSLIGASILPESKYQLTAEGRFPESVWSETGGSLERKQDGAGAEASEFDGWVERRSPADTIHVQIDIVGRLHTIGGGGVGPHTIEYEVEYSDVDGTTGASAQNWTALPTNPTAITNADLNLVRETVAFDLPPAALGSPRYYAVRIRKVTPDEPSPADGGNPNLVAQLEAAEFRFQRDWRSDTRSEQTGRTFESRAQNRIGLVATASKQLSGVIDRFNVTVSSYCWVYVGGNIWDGTHPGAGGNWAWRTSSNPAFSYLHMVRGGYYNSVAGFPTRGGSVANGPNKGWFPGYDVDNEERIFGAGMIDAQIDYASITRWAAFCETQNLFFDAYIQDIADVFETLARIAGVGRASPSWGSGRLGVVYEDPAEPVSAVYNAGNIIAGSFSVSYVSEELPDSYRGTYTHGGRPGAPRFWEASGLWEEKHVTATRPGVVRPRQVGQLDLFGVIETQQAQREVNIAAARTVYQRRLVTWSTSLEGFYSIRGEVVSMAHDLTRWAIGARPWALDVAGAFVRTITLPSPTEWDGTGPLWAWVRLPDMSFVTGQVLPWTGDATTVTLIGNWWPSSDAPCYTGPDVDENTASRFGGDLGPADWLVQIGPTETPGKALRIISHSPQSNGTIRMEAVDESAEVWAHEYDNVFTDIVQPWADPVSGERVPVRVRDLAITRNAAGEIYLEYDLDGATQARVTVSVNNGAAGSFGPTSDKKIRLPEYLTGARLTVCVTAVPDAEGVYAVVDGQSCCEYTIPAPINERSC